MAENVILSKIECSFSYDSTFGAYVSSANNPTFSLIPDQEYRIVWDDMEYTRTAFAFTFADGSQCVGVGNPLAAGQTANDDKFCIVYDDTHKIVHYLSLEQTASHEVAIYQIVEDEQIATGATVVLKDRNGNDLPPFEGVAGVDVLDADGNSQMFLPGEAEEKTVELDFSNGGMSVLPGEGKLLTKVDILKPENLKPENIAEGIDVAGVLGTLAAGGGGAGARAIGGTFKGNGAAMTVYHNLGEIPKMLIIFADSQSSTAKVTMAMGFRSDFVPSGVTYKSASLMFYKASSTYGGSYSASTTALENSNSNRLRGVTSEKFVFGASSGSGVTDSARTYTWVAIV